jgi:hypothetical protein
MVSEIRPYSKKMRRKANEGATTRYIVVEPASNGFLLNVYEVRPTKVRDGGSLGYHYHSVSQEWFLKVEPAIHLAEIAFRSALNSGFDEVIAPPLN